MTVSREDLEACLSRLRASSRDPRRGLYGPGSASWRMNRDSIVFLGGGRAALLQEAHPFVAHAVHQHSRAGADPAGRFRRTFEHVYAMVFGDLEMAFQSARRVHRIHERIRGAISERAGAFVLGSFYEANDEHALLWVHATLCDTSLVIRDLVFGPVSEHERRRWYDETKLFAFLFGVPNEIIPPTWEAFVAYRDRMFASDTLHVGDVARDMVERLLRAPNAWMRGFAWWYRIMTAGLLPPRFREAYGLAFGPREERVYRSSIAGLRASYPRLPARLRYLPAYVEAIRRMQGRTDPDRVGRFVERLAVGTLGSSARSAADT